jgi:uncharacterized protein (DUF736 family)
VRRRSPSAVRSPPRPRGRGPGTAKQGEVPLALIGAFKKSGSSEYAGEIATLSVQAKNVRIVPDATPSGEKAPTHRVYAGRVEIGAAWSKVSGEGREYLGVKLDDPSFAAPIFANLVTDETGDGFSLIWSRRSGRRNDA